MKKTSSLRSVIVPSLLALMALAFTPIFGQILPTVAAGGYVVGDAPNELAFPVNTAGDVLLGATVVAGAGIENTFTSDVSLAGLVDGNLGSDAGVDNHVYFNYPAGTYAFLINLSTPTNLGKLQSIAGWTTDRINQFYTLSYTTAASPSFGSTFTEIGTVAYNPGNDVSADGTGSSTEVTWGDGTSSITDGLAATGLLFQFSYTGSSLNGNDNDPLLREIQAYAVQTVPEPSTYVMILSGLIFLGMLIRRKTHHS